MLETARYAVFGVRYLIFGARCVYTGYDGEKLYSVELRRQNTRSVLGIGVTPRQYFALCHIKVKPDKPNIFGARFVIAE